MPHYQKEKMDVLTMTSVTQSKKRPSLSTYVSDRPWIVWRVLLLLMIGWGWLLIVGTLHIIQWLIRLF